MSKHVVIHKAKPPAPPAPKPWTLLETAIQLALIACVLVGMISISAWIAGPPVPPVGWNCWSVAKSTSAGQEQAQSCYPDRGWREEYWDGIGRVAVPPPWKRHRRYFVRDR